jgi:hypothetical protein
LTLLTLPFAIAFWLIKKLTFGKVDLNKANLVPNWQRQTTDMTFGDMLTWYLTGKYNLRTDVVVRVRNAV